MPCSPLVLCKVEHACTSGILQGRHVDRPVSHLTAWACALETVQLAAALLSLAVTCCQWEVACSHFLAGRDVVQCLEGDAHVPWLAACWHSIEAVEASGIRQAVMVDQTCRRVQAASTDLASALQDTCAAQCHAHRYRVHCKSVRYQWTKDIPRIVLCN